MIHGFIRVLVITYVKCFHPISTQSQHQVKNMPYTVCHVSSVNKVSLDHVKGLVMLLSITTFIFVAMVILGTKHKASFPLAVVSGETTVFVSFKC